MSLVLDVDGRRNEADAPAETALLYVLRNDLRARAALRTPASNSRPCTKSSTATGDALSD